MLRMLGWETLGYADYGRFKNLLFPAVMSLLVLSIFEDSHFWRLVSSGLALLVLLLYIARGPLLLVALQYFFTSLRYKSAGRRRGLLAICIVATALLTFGALGELRSGTGYFAEAMEVRQEYRQWPAGVLWLVGYIGFPGENVLALVEKHAQWELGRRTVLGLLPAFWGAAGRADDYYLSLLPNPLNNVPTYLGWAWLDPGWLGIVAINLIYGSVGGVFVLRPFGRGGLPAVVYYAALATICFNDHLLWFPGLVEMAILAIGERRMRWVRGAGP
jgi:hypothetical protein